MLSYCKTEKKSMMSLISCKVEWFEIIKVIRAENKMLLIEVVYHDGTGTNDSLELPLQTSKLFT